MIEKLAELTFGQLTGYAALIIALLSTVLEVSKIKVNPWSWLGHKISHIISAPVLKELEGMRKEIDTIKQQNDAREDERLLDKALDARRRILRFADEIRRGDRQSHEHYNNIFEDIHYYTNYCTEHPKFENDKAVISIKIIEETYEECTRENDFL